MRQVFSVGDNLLLLMQDYISARDKYNPKNVNLAIKYLFIGESPPESGSYFYFEKATGRGNLFRETMRALDISVGKLQSGADKTPQLREFQSRGCFLIDVSYTPVNKLSAKEKNRALNSQMERLVSDVGDLEPEKIVIVKTNIFLPVKMALDVSGFKHKIQNKGPIPFPSNGWQATYRQMIKEIMRQ